MLKHREKMVQIWASIHRDKLRELEELCQEKGRSVSETVRHAVYHFLHEMRENQK
jgi:hypothetical protein